jgi:hypothetical protein
MMKYSLLPLAVFLSLPALLAGADPNTVAVWSFEAAVGPTNLMHIRTSFTV